MKLKFTKDGLSALAQEAVKRGTGARALRSIIERIMLEVMFDIPSRNDVESVTINAKVVQGKEAPTIKKRKGGKKSDAEEAA